MRDATRIGAASLFATGASAAAAGMIVYLFDAAATREGQEIGKLHPWLAPTSIGLAWGIDL